MTDEDSPVRLVMDPKTSPALKTMVSQARSELPAAATLEAFALRVDAAIATQVIPADVARSNVRSSVTSTVTAKSLILTAALVVGAVGVSVLGFTSRGNVRQPVPLTTSAVSVTSPLPTVTVQTALPSDSATAPITSSVDVANTTAPMPTRAVSTITRGTTKLESTLLESARLALKTDPKRAFQLTQEHAKRYPNGLLSQEREVIAIEALNRLGKRDAAKARGIEFNENFPGSALEPRLQQSLKK
jgi:hypothetical protein